MQKYCSKEVLKKVNEVTGFQAIIPRKKITFRWENESDKTAEIHRNEIVIFESDDLTVTTESEEMTSTNESDDLTSTNESNDSKSLDESSD